jgi:hypothetical protein
MKNWMLKMMNIILDYYVVQFGSHLFGTVMDWIKFFNTLIDHNEIFASSFLVPPFTFFALDKFSSSISIMMASAL